MTGGIRERKQRKIDRRTDPEFLKSLLIIWREEPAVEPYGQFCSIFLSSREMTEREREGSEPDS
jgi:hypothetical protein